VSLVRHLRRRRARLAAVVTGLALCAPAATAMAQPSDQVLPSDHHAIATHSSVVVPSPDAQDAALASTQSRVVVPSPDAQDAGLAATTTSRPDPRSPDARDANIAAVHGPVAATVPASSSPVVVHEHPDALPLALAGAALALALLAAGGVALMTRGRRHPVSIGH
jgi:hypothetical protein